MAIARTGPDEAVSNLSKWAKKVHIHRFPEWLSRKDTDAFVWKWGKWTILPLAAIGVLAYIVWYNSTEAPILSAGMRSTFLYTGDTKLGLIMAVYESSHGLTASPICYLSYFQVTNNSEFPKN